ncbi:MAG: FAD-binding protein, partial [Planctomycetota bacterium]|nr:FAD-binding protein [Planctomycetota bacterium]
MEPLAAHTTLRIGGPAELFYEPQRPEDLAAVLSRLASEGVATRLLGGGANTLAPDAGVHGAVVHTGTLRRVFREGEAGLRVWAGVSLPQLVRTACDAGLSGLEALIGVPGQLGGALAMNAGSAAWGLWDCIAEVTVWDPAGGGLGTGSAAHLKVLRRDECAPSYRDGRLGAWVVLEALLSLKPSDPRAIRVAQEEFLRRKNASQPVTLASAGCAFKNPPGESAGRLVEAAGLKGAR